MATLRSELDHIAIAAPTLAAGAARLQQVLGVAPQPGGEHTHMGTHNLLLKLGEKTYLEIIAINPAAAPPGRARWFELDRLESGQAPRLATWIARTNDIQGALAASTAPLGKIEPMSRGSLNWRMTVPEDGSLPLQGIVPTLIQWPDDTHPAKSLPESGCSLVRLECFHPQADAVKRMLESIGFEGDVTVSALPPAERPYLVAHIDTPTGRRRLI